MHFEPAIEWFPDAGPPRRSLAKMGGITEIRCHGLSRRRVNATLDNHE